MENTINYITRETMLYKTGVEWGNYTINHVFGCAHYCKYPCYAFLMAKRFGKVQSYNEWCSPSLMTNTLELLDKEIPKLKDKIQSVQLCFTTDSFMYGYDKIKEISLTAIGRISVVGIKCTALTKGLLPYDLVEYSKKMNME